MSEPSGYLLDLAPKDLEKVIYFAAYMITEVDDEERTATFQASKRRSRLRRSNSPTSVMRKSTSGK